MLIANLTKASRVMIMEQKMRAVALRIFQDAVRSAKPHSIAVSSKVSVLNPQAKEAVLLGGNAAMRVNNGIAHLTKK